MEIAKLHIQQMANTMQTLLLEQIEESLTTISYYLHNITKQNNINITQT